MIIGLEATRANKKQKTGTEWYAWHLLQYFKKLDHENEFRVFYNQKLEAELEEGPSNFKFIKLNWPLKKLWTHLRLGPYLLSNKVDVFFATNAVPFFHSGKLVVTIHDLGFLSNPKLYHPLEVIYQTLSHALAVRKADKIITISQSSKQDIIKFYPKAKDRIDVVHLGWNKSQFKPLDDLEKKRIREKYDLPKEFLLYAGRIEEKKNIANLIKAYKNASVSESLVLIGRPGNYGYDEIKKLANTNPNIYLLGYIKQDDYGKIVGTAKAFVFPSKFEGFGLPILEAFGSGVPVVCSNIPALKEVAQEAALYFDPDNISDMTEKIKTICRGEELRKRNIEAGLERAKQFSWRKCAEETLEILKKF